MTKKSIKRKLDEVANIDDIYLVWTVFKVGEFECIGDLYVHALNCVPTNRLQAEEVKEDFR